MSDTSYDRYEVGDTAPAHTLSASDLYPREVAGVWQWYFSDENGVEQPLVGILPPVTNAQLSDMAQSTIKGRAVGAGTGDPTDLTATQATAILDLATSTTKGLLSATEEIELGSIDGRDNAGANKRVFRPRDYMVGNAYDPTGVANSTSSFAAMMTAVVAFNDRCEIELAPGVFKVATGTFAGFGSAPITIHGPKGGRGVCVIIPTTATGDMIVLNSAVDGVNISDFAIYQTGSPQTAGDGIDTNGADDVLVEDMLFVNLFNDVNINGSSIKVNVTKCVHSQDNGAAGSVGILVNNGLAGDTYIGPDVVMSNTGATRRRASVEIVESGHYEVAQANLTGSVQGILIDPAAAKIVAFGFHTAVLCDSNTANGCTLDATTTGVIKNIHSTNSWYSGTVAGVGASGFKTMGLAGTINGITFSNDRFLNNRTHGFEHGYGTDVTWNCCDMKGNSADGSAVSNGLNVAANVSNWKVLGGKYGGTDGAPTGGNQGYGILIAAGAATNASIIGPDCSGNVTGPISNASTAVVTILGVIGMARANSKALAGAAFSTVVTYVTPVFLVPKNSLRIGTVLRVHAVLTFASSAASTGATLAKYGTAGVAGDTTVATTPTTTTAANSTVEAVATMYVRTLGGAGTAFFTMGVLNQLSAGFSNNPHTITSAAVAIDTTADRFFGIAMNTGAATNVLTPQASYTEVLVL